jgi:hypothetical protein
MPSKDRDFQVTFDFVDWLLSKHPECLSDPRCGDGATLDGPTASIVKVRANSEGPNCTGIVLRVAEVPIILTAGHCEIVNWARGLAVCPSAVADVPGRDLKVIKLHPKSAANALSGDAIAVSDTDLPSTGPFWFGGYPKARCKLRAGLAIDGKGGGGEESCNCGGKLLGDEWNEEKLKDTGHHILEQTAGACVDSGHSGSPVFAREGNAWRFFGILTNRKGSRLAAIPVWAGMPLETGQTLAKFVQDLPPGPSCPEPLPPLYPLGPLFNELKDIWSARRR